MNARRWMAGLVVGLVAATGTLVAGMLGAVLGIASNVLVAARLPRSSVAGGVCLGLGIAWLILLLRADRACQADCVGPDLGAWYLVGGVLVLLGAVLTIRSGAAGPTP